MKNGKKSNNQLAVVALNRKVRNPTKPSGTTTVTFSSRGIVAPSSESAYANKFVILENDGNLFDANVNDTCYATRTIPVSLRYFFNPGIFASYEQYRVKSIDTTFTWGSMPSRSAVNGMLLFSVDKDSDGSVPAVDVVNRREAVVKQFDNNHLTHTCHWKPWMVRYDDYTTTDQIPYVLPRERWLNCSEYANQRFGTIRAYFEASGRPNYENDPIVRIRHRIVIECRGLINATPNLTSALTPTAPEQELQDNDTKRKSRSTVTSSRRESVASKF